MGSSSAMSMSAVIVVRRRPSTPRNARHCGITVNAMLTPSRSDAPCPQKRRFVGAKQPRSVSKSLAKRLGSMSFRVNSLDAAVSPAPALTDLGALPEWRLQDLYEGMDSPRFAADFERAEREAKLFAEVFRGKLSELAGRPDAGVK